MKILETGNAGYGGGGEEGGYHRRIWADAASSSSPRPANEGRPKTLLQPSTSTSGKIPGDRLTTLLKAVRFSLAGACEGHKREIRSWVRPCLTNLQAAIEYGS